MVSSPMPFWTYMLHCTDRSFYVGHTDDLERRIGAHNSGSVWATWLRARANKEPR